MKSLAVANHTTQEAFVRSTGHGRRVLFVTVNFPPFNSIGAVRTGQTAKYLRRLGWDVRVITVRDQLRDHGLPEGIPDCCVYRERAPALWRLVLRRTGGLRGPSLAATASTDSWWSRVKKSALRSWKRFQVPDKNASWIPFAVLRGVKVSESWHPDLILASGPPFSGLVVGMLLARRLQVPFVPEFRDLWTEEPGRTDKSGVRWTLDRRIEADILRESSAVVTLSAFARSALQARTPAPVVTIYNGFDPEAGWTSEAEQEHSTSPRRGEDTPVLVRYVGSIYPGRRDPDLLFRALSESRLSDDQIHFEFVGSDPEIVATLASKYAVSHLVSVRPRVPHQKALKLQASADVLLLLGGTETESWNCLKEGGVLPGKLFEYLAAGPPVLLLGQPNGEAAGILRTVERGVIPEKPEDVSSTLRAVVSGIHDLPQGKPRRIATYSRPAQVSRLSETLVRIL